MCKIVIKSILLLSYTFCFSQSINEISGIVFIDNNKNGFQDQGELPLPDVLISNGKSIVKTDKEGKYSIKKINGNTVFIIKPSNYISNVNKQNSVFNEIEVFKSNDNRSQVRDLMGSSWDFEDIQNIVTTINLYTLYIPH